MIKSITVVTPKQESLTMELSNPEKSGLAVKSITGLGPPKSDVYSTSLASTDGSMIFGTRMTERNIVITLAMMFDPTIEDSRQKVYHFFPIKKMVTLIVETDNRYVKVDGYVESCEPNIFSKSEDVQISLICPDPYFYGLELVEEPLYGIKPLFEFPFSNESLTEPLLEFGEILMDTRRTIFYEGDVDCGFLMKIIAKGRAKNITLYNTVTREMIKIDTDKITELTGKEFSRGDEIHVSTMRGEKYVHLFRDGKHTNILSSVGKTPDWFLLTPGANTLAFSAEEGLIDLTIWINYHTAYGGI